MNSEYEFAVKKAVIDFVLGGSLKETYKISEHPTDERKGLKEAGTRYKHKYDFLFVLFKVLAKYFIV